MKTIHALIIVPLFALSAAVQAAGGPGARLDPVKVDLNDQKSLLNGARIFINYCVSCHSASFMRYSRIGQDLGIPEEILKKQLLFAADRVGDPMMAVMPRADAKKWFGVAPPDLSLAARARGPNWLYTYLRSFYRDDMAPSGWNNLVFPNVAMPHVLYEWQGHQRAVYRQEEHTHIDKDKDGKPVTKTSKLKVFDKFELERPGTLSTKEFDENMRDLVTFMVYLGEPAKLERYRIGVWVIGFLLLLLVFAYLLKREYWKDIH
ncbi:MAG: cytochrome c1 [Pseudomonadota bacterium]